MTNLIYTSYYAKANCFDPERYALISIAGKAPAGWKFAQYKKLAPSWDIWKSWHDRMEKAGESMHRQEEEDLACQIYTDRFKKEILGKLNPQEVLQDIRNLSKNKTPVLFCYETPEKFCHRHLVAEWLLRYSNAMLDNNAGYDNDLIIGEMDINEPPTHCRGCENSVRIDRSWKCRATNRIDTAIKNILMESVDIYADSKNNGFNSSTIEIGLDRLIKCAQETIENIKEYRETFSRKPGFGAINPIEGPICGYYTGNLQGPSSVD